MPSERAGIGYQVADQRYAFPTVTLQYSFKAKVSDLPGIKSPLDAVNCLLPIFADFVEHHEEFHVLLLNRSNKVLGTHRLSIGGISSTILDLRILFQAAILANASGLVLSHNHPSGTLFPSQNDIDVTRKIQEVAKLLEITVIDHVIITADGHYSFAEYGRL